MKQDFVLHPELKLDRIYNGEIFAELPKFRSNLFWEFVWFPVQEQFCLQFGFNSDPIYFLLRAGFNVIECYKVIIQTLLEWDQWDLKKINSKTVIPWDLFDVC